MKFSIEQASKLLKELGVDAQVVGTDDKGVDKDLNVEDIITKAKEEITTDARSDIETELRDKITSEAVGRQIGKLRSVLARTYGIKTADLKDLEVEDAVKLSKEIYDKNKGAQINDFEEERQKLINDYEEQLETQKANFEERENSLKADHEAAISAANDKYIQRDIDSHFLKLAKAHPTKGGDLEEQAKMLKIRAKESYDLQYDEKAGKVVFLDKDKKKPVADFDESNFAKESYEKWGILATDTRHIDPKSLPKQPGQQQIQTQPVGKINPNMANNAKSFYETLSQEES